MSPCGHGRPAGRILSQIASACLLAALAAGSPSTAGAFAVGHRQVTFVDAARGGRSILTEVYYPSDSGGDGAPAAAGSFPVATFGHGYLMPWSAYAYLWEGLVPAGYFVALPRTEGGLFPSHSAFAADLAFVVTALRDEGEQPASPFYGHVGETSAIMGHSMGGGASFLAAEGNPGITAIANLAAAETSPSAVSAASGITVPALIFSGSHDCVAPAADHQQPMYDALASPCRTFLGITGASHCQFGEYNLTCGLGEGACPPPGLTRAEQHSLVLGLLIPWLDHQLKGDAGAWIEFENQRTGDPRVESQQECAVLAVEGLHPIPGVLTVRCFPNPARGALDVMLQAEVPGRATVEIYDLAGRRVRALWSGPLVAGEHVIPWDGFTGDGLRAPSGVYWVRAAVDGRVGGTALVLTR